MERLIDPTIADLQHEYEDAVRRGRAWRGRWIRVAGCVAFWKVARLSALSIDKTLGRAVAITPSTGTIITALMIWIPLGHAPLRIDSGQITWLVLYLVPQALAISIPVCLALAVFCRLNGGIATAFARRTVLVLAIGCSLVTFANVGWITPAANQAFRTFLVGGPAARGANELTLGELRQRLNFRIPDRDPEDALLMPFWFHIRLALSAAPAVLCLFALAAATSGHRRWSIASVIATMTLYVGSFAMFPASQIAELARWLPAFAIAWIPNAVVGLATIAIVVTGPRATEASAG